MHSSLTAIRVYYFASFGMMGLLLPSLPTWLEAQGLSGARLGAIAASRPAAALLGPILFGILADRWGAPNLLLRWAAVGTLLSALALTLLTGVGLGQFATLLPALLILSILRSPLATLADASVLSSPTTYGTVRLWGSVGFLSVALLAGRFLDPSSPSQFPCLLSLAAAIAAIVTFALPVAKVKPPIVLWRSAKQSFDDGELWLFFGVATVWQFSHAAYDLCLSLHLRDLGASGATIGVAWAIATLAEVALMAFGKALDRRFSPSFLFKSALLVATLRWLLLAWVRKVSVIMVLQPLHAISFGLAWLAAMQTLRQRGDRHLMATLQGAFSASLAIGGTLAMLVWSEIYHRSGATVLFLGASCLSLLAWLGSLRLAPGAPIVPRFPRVRRGSPP